MTTNNDWKRQPQLLTNVFCCLLVIFFINGCATTSSKEFSTENISDKQLYEVGRQEALAGNFDQAIKHLETLNERSPQSPYAGHSMLELGYTYYKAGQFDAAITHLDGYLARQPLGNDADYAWYLRGLVDLMRTTQLSEAAQPDFAAALTFARQAQDSFTNVVQKFPKSKYVASSNQRMGALRNKMAQLEVLQGQALLNKGDYTNAAARAQYVLENFRDTPATSDAINLLRRISEQNKGSTAVTPAPQP